MTETETGPGPERVHKARKVRLDADGLHKDPDGPRDPLSPGSGGGSALRESRDHQRRMIVDEVVLELERRWGLHEDHLESMISDATRLSRQLNEVLNTQLDQAGEREDIRDRRITVVENRIRAMERDLQLIQGSLLLIRRIAPVQRRIRRWKRRRRSRDLRFWRRADVVENVEPLSDHTDG